MPDSLFCTISQVFFGLPLGLAPSLPCNILRHTQLLYSLPHTHMHNRFTAFWTLSGTTWVSQYQKKLPPTHAYPLSASSICFDPWHPPSLIYVPDSLFHNLCLSFLWSTSWPGTLLFILHTFLHPIIVFFLQYIPYHRNLFCCSTEVMSSNPSLSLNPLLGTLSCSLTPHIHLTILISSH